MYMSVHSLKSRIPIKCKHCFTQEEYNEKRKRWECFNPYCIAYGKPIDNYEAEDTWENCTGIGDGV